VPASLASLSPERHVPLYDAEELLAIAQPHLDRARKQIEGAIDASLAPLRRYFEIARRGVPEFVEATDGWIATGKYLWDVLPGTANVRLKGYLKEEFERLVINPMGLQQGLEASVTAFAKAINSFENQMLVALKEDLESFDNPLLPGLLNHDLVQQLSACDEIIGRSQMATQDGVILAINQAAISELARVIIGKVFRRMTTSGILYATAATGAPATAGLSLVAAVLIDFMVGWIWDWYADPHGKLEREMYVHLSDLLFELTSGPQGIGGLRDEMLNVAQERATQRQIAITRLIRDSLQSERQIENYQFNAKPLRPFRPTLPGGE